MDNPFDDIRKKREADQAKANAPREAKRREVKRLKAERKLAWDQMISTCDPMISDVMGSLRDALYPESKLSGPHYVDYNDYNEILYPKGDIVDEIFREIFANMSRPTPRPLSPDGLESQGAWQLTHKERRNWGPDYDQYEDVWVDDVKVELVHDTKQGKYLLRCWSKKLPLSKESLCEVERTALVKVLRQMHPN